MLAYWLEPKTPQVSTTAPASPHRSRNLRQIYFYPSISCIPRCFNPRQSLGPVTQTSDRRALASRTQKHTRGLLRASERTCFQWKPESTLPRGQCVDYIFSEVEQKEEKRGLYQRLCLVLHQSSSKYQTESSEKKGVI